MTEQSVPGVLGTETEFGITIRNQPEFNPVLASSLVINSYTGGASRIQWSYEEESPGRDARGFGYEPLPTGEFESGLVNVVLTNGARLYVDHAHPEYATPECSDPLEAALHDKAGDLVMARAAERASALLAPEQTLYIHKNNSDGKGNSYGAHENYLVPRSVPFGDLVTQLTPFFVSRQVFTGAGKVGSESGRPPASYQISQRADFFEEEVGLETTLKRPIINTRDEPHADPARYRRLHVIIGDSNMSETQTFLRLGTTWLLLEAVASGTMPEPPALVDPVQAVWRVSHDPKLEAKLEMGDGSRATAIEIQRHYLEWVAGHVASRGRDQVSGAVLDAWEGILADLERDPASTADRLDWTAKKSLLDAYRDRDDLEWGDPKLRLLDLQYHDIDPKRSLYHRLVGAGRMRRLFTDEQVQAAATTPPAGTRAWFRGRCVEKYGSAIVAANWDSLIFDVGDESLRRVPMMEPRRGTRDLVGDLIEGSSTPAELIVALEGRR